MKSLLNEIIGHGVCAVLYGKGRGPDSTGKIISTVHNKFIENRPLLSANEDNPRIPLLKKCGSAQANPVII